MKYLEEKIQAKHLLEQMLARLWKGRENRILDLENGGKTELRQGRKNNEEGDKDCRGEFFYLRKHLSDQFLFVQADSDNQQREQNRLFVIRSAEYNISA